jgi:hypothetical protein
VYKSQVVSELRIKKLSRAPWNAYDCSSLAILRTSRPDHVEDESTGKSEPSSESKQLALR